jgi:hypothetical protein
LRPASEGAFSVSFQDITAIRAQIGQTAQVEHPADIDKNGSIGFTDIMALRANVGGRLTQITIPPASLD